VFRESRAEFGLRVHIAVENAAHYASRKILPLRVGVAENGTRSDKLRSTIGRNVNRLCDGGRRIGAADIPRPIASHEVSYPSVVFRFRRRLVFHDFLP
jgi:hypothetical protein